jgi:hypothetical protein
MSDLAWWSFVATCVLLCAVAAIHEWKTWPEEGASK